MEVVTTRAELHAALDAARRDQRAVGFVPTMGALHIGHRSLLARARADAPDGLVAVSIFVNPLQFGPAEDLATYPRDLEGDLAICAEHGADVVFTPTTTDLWPQPPTVRLSAGAFGETLEGAHRPGHLDGVATVVATLFNLVRADRAYFGKKDAQQLAMVRRMVADLAFGVEVVGCDTIREADGLAVSSRNAYLGPEERAAAPALYRALAGAQEAFAAGERRPDALEKQVTAALDAAPLVELEYAALVDPDTFTRVGAQAAAGQVLALAASIGRPDPDSGVSPPGPRPVTETNRVSLPGQRPARDMDPNSGVSLPGHTRLIDNIVLGQGG